MTSSTGRARSTSAQAALAERTGVCELGEVGLADQHGAGFTKRGYLPRVGGWLPVLEGSGSARGDLVLRVVDVFERDRHTEYVGVLARCTVGIRCSGLLERVVGDRDERPEPELGLVVGGDAVEVCLRDLHGADRAGAHVVLQLHDRLAGHVIGDVGCTGSLEGSRREHEGLGAGAAGRSEQCGRVPVDDGAQLIDAQRRNVGGGQQVAGGCCDDRLVVAGADDDVAQE